MHYIISDEWIYVKGDIILYSILIGVLLNLICGFGLEIIVFVCINSVCGIKTE